MNQGPGGRSGGAGRAPAAPDGREDAGPPGRHPANAGERSVHVQVLAQAEPPVPERLRGHGLPADQEGGEPLRSPLRSAVVDPARGAALVGSAGEHADRPGARSAQAEDRKSTRLNSSHSSESRMPSSAGKRKKNIVNRTQQDG